MPSAGAGLVARLPLSHRPQLVERPLPDALTLPVAENYERTRRPGQYLRS